MVKVRAIKPGFYADTFRAEGAVFDIVEKAHLGSWMAVVEEPKPVEKPAKVKAADKGNDLV